MLEDHEGNLRINGKEYDPSDLSFREQREVKRLIAEELMPGEDVDMEALTLADLIPATIVVLVRRDDPSYTLDQALDLHLKDVVVQTNGAGPAKAPPTSRRSSKTKTPAPGGRPS